MLIGILLHSDPKRLDLPKLAAGACNLSSKPPNGGYQKFCREERLGQKPDSGAKKTLNYEKFDDFGR